MKHVLAIDYGLKHIGIAIGQTITRSANGITTVKAKNGHPNWIELCEILREHAPSIIIVGNPLNMDGSPSEMSKKAAKFAIKLGKKIKIPITLVDERLTSKEAKEIISTQYTIKKSSNKVHELAACLIAETWLNSN